MSVPDRPYSVEQEYRDLKLFVNTLFPEPHTLTFVVPADAQQRELERLRQGMRAEQFFFVIDLVNFKLTNATNLEEIGYDSGRFTFRQYLNIIAPQSMLPLLTLLGRQAYTLADRALLSFMNPKFVAHIPVTCANGQVMLTKRTASTWQHSDKGQLTAYVSEFVVIKPYENEPMNPRFINLNPSVEAAFSSTVARVFANLPARDNLFSPKEIILLRLYAEIGDADLTAKEMAAKAGITLNTIHTHNRNILQKAKTMFGDELAARTARDVAVFLKRCNLLG